MNKQNFEFNINSLEKLYKKPYNKLFKNKHAKPVYTNKQTITARSWLALTSGV